MPESDAMTSDERIDQLVNDYREQLEYWRHQGFDAVLEAGPDEMAHGIFRGKHRIDFDEPEFTTISHGDVNPCPHDYLIASAVGCQIEILKQCLKKARVEDYHITIEAESVKEKVDVDEEIPDYFDILISAINSDVSIEVPEEFESRANRCLEVFERNCTMSMSIKKGVDINTAGEVKVVESADEH